ncbi:hypothetical protein NDU88_008961 [Pleurodeles waltl]|uniref:Uncharacterized protein n=1 Tax=Pleurodeles waltl TaxID=8319 RepID=A0AAV7PY66_PLEWA|nr:hypothetical protein NDU88_008961 [Pleurodeles waltl]
MAPQVLADPHRRRSVRKAINKERGGRRPQHLSGTPLCSNGADRHTLSLPAPGPHGTTTAPAPPLMRCPPGPSTIPRPVYPRARPPAPLLPHSLPGAPPRPADGPQRSQLQFID